MGKGSFKEVYKGFDTKLGIEVAWNKVNSEHAENLNDKVCVDRVLREFQIMKGLDNPYVVRCYGGWRDPNTLEINFITELFTSGSLRTYRWKHPGLDLELAMNKWGRNILSGLHYMHSQTPPIVHRDLRCDYVFINGNNGEVKIADLGRASFMHLGGEKSGSARDRQGFNYMAAEMYDSKYTTAADIYSFGLLLLELATMRRPYDEWTNDADLFRAVFTGKPPEALKEVKDSDLNAIIRACLAKDPDMRPTALDLLQLDYFRKRDPGELVHVQGVPKEGSDTLIALELTLPHGPAMEKKVVKFEFDIVEDTASSIAAEMIADLELPTQMATVVAHKINNSIASLMGVSPENVEHTQMRLVRVRDEAQEYELPSVMVVEEHGGTCFQVEFNSLSDRHDLFFDVITVFHNLNLQVVNMVYSTERGAVIEDCSVKLYDGSKLEASYLEQMLLEAVAPHVNTILSP